MVNAKTEQEKKKAPAKPKRAPRKRAAVEPKEVTAQEQEAGKPSKEGGCEMTVDEVLQKIAERLSATEIKPSVGDYLRLLQYREERAHDEQPKEIRVTWVEPETTESETSE
jgi:hypothetical protein